MRNASIYDIVRQIPPGRVASYGQVARLAGCGARQAGYALARLPDHSDVPWHRVVNAQGRVSLPGAAGDRQAALLKAEGIEFSTGGAIDWRICGWPGPAAASKIGPDKG